jgi:hypothetical protein
MTTKNKKDFDAVEFMRQQRDKISQDITGMDYKQIKEYLAKKRGKERILPGRSEKQSK